MEITSAVERDDEAKLQYLLSSGDIKATLKTVSSLRFK
jgi:hypothetical protein